MTYLKNWEILLVGFGMSACCHGVENSLDGFAVGDLWGFVWLAYSLAGSWLVWKIHGIACDRGFDDGVFKHSELLKEQNQ